MEIIRCAIDLDYRENRTECLDSIKQRGVGDGVMARPPEGVDSLWGLSLQVVG
jgi:hypothetical protein